MKEGTNNKTIIYILLALVIVFVGLFFFELTSNTISYSPSSSSTSIIYTQNPPQYHNLTLLSGGYVFSLPSLNAPKPSFLIVNFELPVNVTNITLSGSFTASGNAYASILTPIAYGKLEEVILLNNITQQVRYISNLLSGSYYFIGNTTSSNINLKLPATYTYNYAPYNATCPTSTNTFFSADYLSWCEPPSQPDNIYSLIFFNLNQNTNETVSIVKAIQISYETH